MGDHDQRKPDSAAGGGRESQQAPQPPTAAPNPKAGVDREVGDLEDPDAVEDEGALPGRMGGGLAGG